MFFQSLSFLITVIILFFNSYEEIRKFTNIVKEQKYEPYLIYLVTVILQNIKFYEINIFSSILINYINNLDQSTSSLYFNLFNIISSFFNTSKNKRKIRSIIENENKYEVNLVLISYIPNKVVNLKIYNKRNNCVESFSIYLVFSFFIKLVSCMNFKNFNKNYMEYLNNLLLKYCETKSPMLFNIIKS